MPLTAPARTRAGCSGRDSCACMVVPRVSRELLLRGRRPVEEAGETIARLTHPSTFLQFHLARPMPSSLGSAARWRTLQASGVGLG